MKLHPSFLILSVILLSCGTSPDRNDLKDLLIERLPNFEQVNTRFLSQGALENLNISKLIDSVKCESINEWTNCNEGWETWDEETKQTIRLSSKEEVLKAEKIKIEDYNYFYSFLKSNGLESIMRVYECPNCVDLENKLVGLRYTTNRNYNFDQDFDYVIVERINENWFVYERDWN